MLKLILKLCLILGCLWSVPSFAQTDFSKWNKHALENPEGHELISPSGGPLIRIQTYSRTGLEESSKSKLNKFGSSKQEQIEYALSILSLAMSWDETFDGTTLSGLVQASDGVYSFKAALSPNGDELSLALVATDDDGNVLTGPVVEARRVAGVATSAGVAGKTLAQNTTKTRSTLSKPKTPRRVLSNGYKPPETVAEMDNWESIGKLTKSLNPKDLSAPRYYLAQTGPKYGVRNFSSAIKKLPTVSPLKLRGNPTVEPLEAWTQYDGSQAAIVMQQTWLNGEPGVIVLFMTKKKGQNDILYLGYEVTEKTFLEWGGVTRLMKLRRVIPSINSFPKPTRDRIARSPFKQQTQVYEAGLNKVLENGVASMYAMSQAQTLMRMQELNYDLLLGGDITSPMISD